jgi:hypothetical protein
MEIQGNSLLKNADAHMHADGTPTSPQDYADLPIIVTFGCRLISPYLGAEVLRL